MDERSIETFDASWDGIALEITFERNWLSSRNPTMAHLEIRSTEPLPITKTGYHSHFCHPSIIDDEGGPVAFVLAWLDALAKTKKWRATVPARHQLSLFD